MPEEANLMPISRVYIRTISFVYAGRKTSLGKMPFISRKAKKKGDFWEEACLCLFISPQWVTQACEQTGDLQHRYSSNLSSSTFHKPGLTSGLAAIWNEVSNLCCPLQQHGTHQRPWGTPAVEAPTDTWAGDKQRFILFQSPATHVASWTCWVCHRKHKASSVSPDACLKKAARPFTHGSCSYYLLECFWFVGGKKRPLMYEVGLNSPEPNSPKVTHCFRVLYLRVGLGLDGAVFIFLLSAALLISEKNNQPICSMLRNKNKIISIFQMKAITKEQQWQPDGVRKSIQKTHCHLGSFY